MADDASWRAVPLRKVYAVVVALIVIVAGLLVYNANHEYGDCGCKPSPVESPSPTKA